MKIGPRVDIRVCPDDASQYCEPGYVFYDNKNNGRFITLLLGIDRIYFKSFHFHYKIGCVIFRMVTIG